MGLIPRRLRRNKNKTHVDTPSACSGVVHDNYYYGIPPRMDIDGNGNIYVMQKHSNCIRVYDKQGKYLYHIGRKGRGPGEFLDIQSFAFGQDYKKLYVADRAYKIQIFTLKNNKYQYTTTIFPNFIEIDDLCVLGQDLFVSGYKIARKDLPAYKNRTKRLVELKAAKPITRFDLKTLKPTLSFGYVYKSWSGSGMYNAELSQTMLGCNTKTGTVVGFLKNFPYIFGYDQNGHRKWVSKMDGYKSVKFIEFKKSEYPVPGLIPVANKKPFNWNFPIEPINDGPYSLLQYGWELPQPKLAASKNTKFNPEHKTVLVDTRTGKLFYSDIYPIIGAWKHNTVVTTNIVRRYEKDIIHIDKLN